MPQDEDGRGNKPKQEEDPYIEALERFKKRSLATFGVVIFYTAMLIAGMVEIAGMIKVWDTLFHGTVHAEPVSVACPIQPTK